MSAVNEAFHGIRRMISSGRLESGQRLPPETELCNELGVSRSPMREAVRMLSALGVVESRHGSGVYVSSLRAEKIIGSLSLTVDLLPLSGLLEMYEIRRVLESYTAGQAAARASQETHRELEALLEELNKVSDPDQASELDGQFHDLIARASGNPTLAILLGVFRGRSQSYQIYGAGGNDEVRKISERGHRQIAQAIIAGDPTLASVAAADHVAQTEAWLREIRPKPGEAPSIQERDA